MNDNPQGINAAALRIIEALNGDPRKGMALCPAHPDRTPSLSVRAGTKVPVVFYCHAGCTYEQVAAALNRMGLWPVAGTDTVTRSPPVPRSAEERRQYAVRILHDVRRNRGRRLAPLLKNYFAPRGIERVPDTALLALPIRYVDSVLVPRIPGMVFRVSDGQRTLGVHVTWLNADVNGKREENPQRQFYGPIRGGFVKLFRGDHDPKQPLLIAEGIETACAAAQISGLPAISALSAENMPFITPPPAREYIIAADNDRNGTGERAARALARNLTAAGATVRIALAPQLDSDWNDEIMP